MCLVVGLFLRQRQIEKDEIIKENMLEYLIELLQDALDHSWAAAKGAHFVLINRIIDGLASWSDLNSVQKIRERYAKNPSNQANDRQRTLKNVPFFKFNRRGGCHEQNDHVHQQLLLKHSCQTCFQVSGRFEDHSKFKCPRQIHVQSKNV